MLNSFSFQALLAGGAKPLFILQTSISTVSSTSTVDTLGYFITLYPFSYASKNTSVDFI